METISGLITLKQTTLASLCHGLRHFSRLVGKSSQQIYPLGLGRQSDGSILAEKSGA